MKRSTPYSMQVILPTGCGNAPKNAKLEQFVYQVLTGDSAYKDFLLEGVELPSFPQPSAKSIAKICYGISHGKAGAVLVEIEGDEALSLLAFHCEFATFKAEKLREVRVTLGYKEK